MTGSMTSPRGQQWCGGFGRDEGHYQRRATGSGHDDPGRPRRGIVSRRQITRSGCLSVNSAPPRQRPSTRTSTSSRHRSRSSTPRPNGLLLVGNRARSRVRSKSTTRRPAATTCSTSRRNYSTACLPCIRRHQPGSKQQAAARAALAFIPRYPDSPPEIKVNHVAENLAWKLVSQLTGRADAIMVGLARSAQS